MFANSRGWPLPPACQPHRPGSPGGFSKAAREETRQDYKTGRPYRVYHAFTSDVDGQGMLWVDIDEAPRKYMLKSAIMRREQMVGDAVQLTFDLDHWNSTNGNEEPIIIPLDFTDDVDMCEKTEGMLPKPPPSPSPLPTSGSRDLGDFCTLFFESFFCPSLAARLPTTLTVWREGGIFSVPVHAPFRANPLAGRLSSDLFNNGQSVLAEIFFGWHSPIIPRARCRGKTFLISN